MDRAIHKETKENLRAVGLKINASYQEPLKEKWLAPKDGIKNWEELEKQGIKEIRVHYVDEKEYPHWNKNKPNETIWVSPCFAIYPNSPAKTIAESKEHKMLKDWLFNRLKKDDLKLTYSTIKKPNKYKNFVKLSELNIDWNNYDIEVRVGGFKRLRADILLPLKEKHELFGKGIDFEIQLQNEKRIFDRSIKWALNGYSIVWLFEKDFDFNKDRTQIELKNKEPRIFSYASELYYSGKEHIRNLKNECINQSKLLNIKLDEVSRKSNKLIGKCDKNINEIELKADNLYKKNKEQIENFLDTKIKELGKNFNEEIIKRIKKDFCTENEELKNIVKEVAKEIIEINVTKEFIEQRFDTNSIIEEIIKEGKNILYKEFKLFYGWKEMIAKAPPCLYCKGNSLKPILKKNGSWAYICENPICKKWTNIPNNIQEKLRSEGWENYTK